MCRSAEGPLNVRWRAQKLLHFALPFRHRLERLRPQSESNTRREALEKLQQSLARLLGPLFQHPMPGVLQHDNRHIGSNQLHLLCQRISQGLLTADHEDWHGELGLRELSEIPCGLLERDKVGPTRTHASG